jgi:hypothetical protein
MNTRPTFKSDVEMINMYVTAALRELKSAKVSATNPPQHEKQLRGYYIHECMGYFKYCAYKLAELTNL